MEAGLRGGLLDGDDLRATDDEPPSDGPAEEVAMSRKSPAPGGAKITTADVEAAERDRIVAASLRLQQAMASPPPTTPMPEVERVLRALDRFDRAPTSEEVASQQAQARLAEVARRNADGAEECRAFAGRMAASGYQGWTGGDR